MRRKPFVTIAVLGTLFGGLLIAGCGGSDPAADLPANAAQGAPVPPSIASNSSSSSAPAAK